MWERSDSNETFYSCSDVVFDGGNGEVTGVGPGNGTPTDPPTDPPGDPGMVCTAAFRSVNSWGGGYQGEVTVTNTGTLPINGWMAHLTFANGETVESLWNGTYTQSGPDVTVSNADWNGALEPGASTTFGFTVQAPGSASDLEPHCMTS